jgi:hypothetical protein
LNSSVYRARVAFIIVSPSLIVSYGIRLAGARSESHTTSINERERPVITQQSMRELAEEEKERGRARLLAESAAGCNDAPCRAIITAED